MWQTTSARAVYYAKKGYYYFKWLPGKVTISYIIPEESILDKSWGSLELHHHINSYCTFLHCFFGNKHSVGKKTSHTCSCFPPNRWPIWWERIEELIMHLLALRGDMIPATVHSKVWIPKKEKKRFKMGLGEKKNIPSSDEIKLSVKKFRLSTRKYFLTLSSIRPWNSFSEEVVEESWLESFQPILDKTFNNVLQGAVLCWQGLDKWLMDCLLL